MTDPLPPSSDVAAGPAAALAAPPTDVQVLLRTMGVANELSVYFDAQHDAALQQARQQWPALWRMAFGGA